MKGLGIDKKLKFGSWYMSMYKEQQTLSILTSMINYSWSFLAKQLDKNYLISFTNNLPKIISCLICF